MKKVEQSLLILKNRILNDPFQKGLENINVRASLTPNGYTEEFGKTLQKYLANYRKNYQLVYNEQVKIGDMKRAYFEKEGFNLNQEKNNYYNESLADLVKNVNTKERLVVEDDRVIQLIDPIFQDTHPKGILDYRAGFFFPQKSFLGIKLSTYTFNSIAIWLLTISLYTLLYFEILRKLVQSSHKMPFVNGK